MNTVGGEVSQAGNIPEDGRRDRQSVHQCSQDFVQEMQRMDLRQHNFGLYDANAQARRDLLGTLSESRSRTSGIGSDEAMG